MARSVCLMPCWIAKKRWQIFSRLSGIGKQYTTKMYFSLICRDLMRIRLVTKKRITFIRMRILPYMCIFLGLVVNYIKVNGIIFFGWQIYMMIPDYFLSHFAFVMTFAEKFNFGKELTCEEIMHQVESMFQEKFSGAREEVFGHECVVSTGRLR